MKKGDLVVLHGALDHASLANTSPKSRHTFQVTAYCLTGYTLEIALILAPFHRPFAEHVFPYTWSRFYLLSNCFFFSFSLFPLIPPLFSARRQLHVVEGPRAGVEWSHLNWLQYNNRSAATSAAAFAAPSAAGEAITDGVPPFPRLWHGGH